MTKKQKDMIRAFYVYLHMGEDVEEGRR